MAMPADNNIDIFNHCRHFTIIVDAHMRKNDDEIGFGIDMIGQSLCPLERIENLQPLDF